MSKNIPYDRNSPYNQLPLLPPIDEKVIDIEILTKLAKTRGALGKLDGIWFQPWLQPQKVINI
jgi:hypothetical protein